jgi:hypothetical protein
MTLDNALENTENQFSPDDLELYIYKKILIEKWRDDLPFPIIELSFYKNTVEEVCRVLWFLHSPEIVYINYNTRPEDFLAEGKGHFEDETIMNWPFIEDLDKSPDKIDKYYGFDIEILEETNLKKMVDNEIREFVLNKANTEGIGKFRGCYADPDGYFYSTPSYLRGIGSNIYSYKKQRVLLLSYIAELYEQFENEMLVIKFQDIKVKNIKTLLNIVINEELVLSTK